jgi:hypothetical protein
MGFPHAESYAGQVKDITFWIVSCIVRHTRRRLPMSALCQKRTSMREVFAHPLVQDVGFASTEKP